MKWSHPKPVTPGHSCVTTKPTSPKGVDMTENVREGGSKAMGVETGTRGPDGLEWLTSGPESVCAQCDGVGRLGRFICECQPDALTPSPLRTHAVRLRIELDEARSEVERLTTRLTAERVVSDSRNATIERLTKEAMDLRRAL